MTYAELLQKVRDYTEVGSSVLTDSIIQSMIRDAELRIFREVDADYTREYATANVNIGSPYLDLPASPATTSTRTSIIVRSVLVFDSNQSHGVDSFDNNDNEERLTLISFFYDLSKTDGSLLKKHGTEHKRI
ncbi:hypothetical protein [Phenylobacterium sp.]|uniref:phage adaptor protein n=1 Tax=Phenylobacterium sp. TaxID=1871053 RepID=UPI00260036B0|nr:hypothetical protein [Phenylobacterium sp.]